MRQSIERQTALKEANEDAKQFCLIEECHHLQSLPSLTFNLNVVYLKGKKNETTKKGAEK